MGIALSDYSNLEKVQLASRSLKDLFAKCEKVQLEMELCAGVPATPHMFRGQIRALSEPFKTSVQGIFDPGSTQAMPKADVQGKNAKVTKSAALPVQTVRINAFLLFCPFCIFTLDVGLHYGQCRPRIEILSYKSFQ